MPSLTTSTGTKFQLPALDLKFGSLTEGTDIPPPPPSPKDEKPEHAQLPTDSLVKSGATNNGTQTTPEVQAQRNGIQSPSGPLSPLSPKGPSNSVYRLIIRRVLGQALRTKNHDRPTGDGMFPRPVSQSNASIATDGQKRTSTGWFRRLRGSDGLDSKRSSKVWVSSENTKPLPKGPPAPMIPEFKSLGSKVDLGGDGGSLGSDMFKDIK